MVGGHGFLRGDLTVGNEAQEVDERQLVLGVVDLAAEQGDTGAVLLGFA